MTGLKAIIFDMDGTLADTEDIHRQAFNDAFAEFDLPFVWDPPEYKRLLAISGGRERLRLYLQDHADDSVFTGPVSELALRLHRRKSEIYRRKLVDGHVRLRPGVERLIEDARSQGMVLAIATSSSTRNAETLLREALGANALELFSAIVTCDIIDEKKPSPAVYLHALDRLGLKAGECVALEDQREPCGASRRIAHRNHDSSFYHRQ
jgi:HAD superfamily hydrolase (TIGR01509 family)